MTLHQTLTGLVAALGIATTAYAKPSPPTVDPDVKAVVEMVKQRPDSTSTMPIMSGAFEGARRTGLLTRYHKKLIIGSDEYFLGYNDHNKKDIALSSDGVIDPSDVLELRVNTIGTKKRLYFEDHGLNGFKEKYTNDFMADSRGVFSYTDEYTVRTEEALKAHRERARNVHQQYFDFIRLIKRHLQPPENKP